MPTLSSILRYAAPVAAQGVGALANRRAIGNAQQSLTGGVDRSRELIDTGTRASQEMIRSGSEQAAGTLGTTYANQRATLQPFQQAGAGSLETLSGGVAPGGEYNQAFNNDTFDLYKDPSYQFRVSEGEKIIRRQGNAALNRFSGATLKALTNYNQEAASQEYQNAFNRHQTDTQGRFNRVREVSRIGENAANTEVQAGSAYGANLSNLQSRTGESLANIENSRAQQIAALEIERANAEAGGNIAQANNITDTINGILNTVDQVGTASQMSKYLGLGTGAASTGLGLGTGAAGVASSLAIPAAPAGLIASSAPMTIGGLSSGGAAAGAGGAAGGGGATAAITGFLKNPITIAAGAALGIGLLVRRAQSHHKANDWVQGFQNKFDQTMAGIDQQLQAGQISPEDAQALKQANVKDYFTAAQQFAQQGNDHKEVIQNAMNTFQQQYGDPRQYGA